MLDQNKNKGTPRPYLRNINVRWFSVDTSDVLEMRIEDSEVERYGVKKGDLLICEGGYPGRASIWTNDEEIFFQKALHRVRFADEVHGRLLMYYLFMTDQTGALKESFSGTGIQHFTRQALARFQMPIPSPEVASEMVDRIEAMRQTTIDLAKIYENKLQSLDDLRQALLQKAFAGALTCRLVP
jgi:type I restriction enzyme S subunit